MFLLKLGSKLQNLVKKKNKSFCRYKQNFDWTEFPM